MSLERARAAEYGWWPVLVYPLVLASSLSAYYFLKRWGLSIVIYTNAPITLAAMAIVFFEWYTPHRKSWSAQKSEYATDAFYMVTVQMLLPKILAFATVGGMLTVLRVVGWDANAPDALKIWPHHWNPIAQATLMLVVADFPRYWLHWLAHRSRFLWPLHAVHHASNKLYWLNVNRFHPLDKALQFLCDGLPFLILSVHADILALYFVFYAVNGFFQHCNIELRMGFLNYILSGPELHRWHHSRKIEESNSNYGNKIILWDLIFGTYFQPKNRNVQELGVLNSEYPVDFKGQMLAPFSGPIDKQVLPYPTFKNLLLNGLLYMRMGLIEKFIYRPFVEATKNPRTNQLKVLISILTKNQDTQFGKEHDFASIRDYATYCIKVPVNDYETLRPYIDKQMIEGLPALTISKPCLYNQTSGTTGKPKYIPVIAETLKALADSQKIVSYVQYRACPEAFQGKILAFVSPAIEGSLSSGAIYGSASGHIYASMPMLARSKYALPVEIFAIADYELKYQVMARFAIAQKSITYLASANPNYLDLVADLASGQCRQFEAIASLQALSTQGIARLRQKLLPLPKRAAELRALFETGRSIRLADIWPYLKIVGTWTGGSCGIPLKAVMEGLPEGTKTIDLGYVSSEFRGTITIDADSNGGVPTLQENFFEFVERKEFEEGRRNFLLLVDLKVGKEYYLFVTTPAGLYRYDMNDILRVQGFFNATPTLVFVQKGRGMTNITGEKLSENQIITAVAKLEQEFGMRVLYFQMLADELTSCYDLYLELRLERRNFQVNQVGDYLDLALQAENVEYQAKRQSGRLHALKVHILKPETSEIYKQYCLSQGQREGQFKPLILQYRKDFHFKIAEHCQV
jgi:sterol desaturase/sphingolipid hydroxylase (fatty acid hydroxylase superfamily)